MRSALEAILTDIKDLKIFVESQKKVYGVLSEHGDEAIRSSIRVRRRLDYASFIVAAYNALERFVEDLAWAYAELESSRNEYSSLWSKLRKKHLRKSAELLSRGFLGEGRYLGVSDTDVVANLHECLSGKTPYNLNRHAVVHHDANFRSQEIQGVFVSLGIENVNTLTCRTDSMVEWFIYSYDTDFSSVDKEKKVDIIGRRLDDLVDRRNQVAHRGAGSDDLVSHDEMSDRLGFLEAYARSLFSVVANDYLYRYYIDPGFASSLGKPTRGPYNSGTVVVVSKPPVRIFVGQPIIGVLNNRVDRWGEILEIQVDDTSKEIIDADYGTTSVGLKADFKFTKNIELYVLPSKDMVIWG